jgi:hypothetical protein
MVGRIFAWEGAVEAIPRRCRWGAGLAAVALVMAGCASTGGGLSKDSPAAVKESAVAERAKARWQALVKRNYEEAYGYFSRTSKDTTTLAAFQAKVASIEYRSVNVDKVECVAEVCTVKLTLTYDYAPAKAKGVVTPLDENWIIDQGQAWFVYRG